MPTEVPIEAPKPSLPPKRAELAIFDRVFLAIENPVLRRELLTSLRSNKAFLIQFCFLLVLAAVVFLAWPQDTVATRSELARKLFQIFGRSQLVLVALMAPAFSAGAMTLEKEKRCLDLLLTSPIQPGTILMGKYLSSVLYLFLLVLSTAPLVSIILWLPGLSPWEVGGLYLLLLSIAGCFGMIGLACSTFFHRSQTSLALTYMIVLPLALILFACSFSDGFFTIEVAVWPTMILLAATIVMYRACHARLRQPFDPVFKAAEEEDITTQTGLVLVRDRFPDNLLAPPSSTELLPDGVNPIYQKEIRSEIFGRGTLFLRLIIQISMFLSVIFLTALYLEKEFIFVDYIILFTMLVAPAFACNTFTQERERGTLDLLLTTLIRPGQIIAGKFLSCLRLSFFLTGLVGVTLSFFLLVGKSGSLQERAVWLGIYVGIIAGTIFFETALAMFFSLFFRSTVHSMIATYTVLLLVFCAPVAAKQLQVTFARQAEMALTGSNPGSGNPETTPAKSKSAAAGAFASVGGALISYSTYLSPFEAVYSVVPKGNEIDSPNSTIRAMPQNFRIWHAYLPFCVISGLALLGCVYFLFDKKCAESTSIR